MDDLEEMCRHDLKQLGVPVPDNGLPPQSVMDEVMVHDQRDHTKTAWPYEVEYRGRWEQFTRAMAEWFMRAGAKYDGLHESLRAQRRKRLEGKTAEIYKHLWTLVHDGKRGCPSFYCTRHFLTTIAGPEANASFTRELAGKALPRIWIARTPLPADTDEPDTNGADLRELIALAHERGHERDDREPGRSPAEKLAEEQRAWGFAAEILAALHFDEWPQFERYRAEALASYEAKLTP